MPIGTARFALPGGAARRVAVRLSRRGSLLLRAGRGRLASLFVAFGSRTNLARHSRARLQLLAGYREARNGSRRGVGL